MLLFASIKTTFQFSVEMASHSHKFPMFSPSLIIIFHIYMLLLFVISASTNQKTNSKISGSTESQIECSKFTFNKHVHMGQCITNQINAHTATTIRNPRSRIYIYIYMRKRRESIRQSAIELCDANSHRKIHIIRW